MNNYNVRESDTFSAKVAALPNRDAFVKSLAKLVKIITINPRSKGGVLKFGGSWIYGLWWTYKIEAIISDGLKEVILNDLRHLPGW